MKFTLSVLEKSSEDKERRWPSYMFGGRIRTSTLVLILIFMSVWWVYSAERPQAPAHGGPPSTQVVPPGFVPDPNYTWVPRTRLQPAPITVPPTPTTTVPTTPPPPPPPVITTTSPPPFVLPTPPCLLPPPFCPASASPTTSPPQLPQPGPGPPPTSALPNS